MNKDKYSDRIIALEGDPNSLKNQGISFILAQQFQLCIDLEKWLAAPHYGIEAYQIKNVVDSLEKRNKFLEYIYNKIK
tara:strand:+ start:82 stop:315 length:234 start_codon:yes stop_codon:yes gene_type:complete